MTVDDDIRALLREAGKLPLESRTRLDLLDEVVRRADAQQNVPLAFEARRALIHTGSALARGDAIAVAFTWCLHQADQRPDLFAGYDLLNEYSLVIGRLANYDTVSRSQLEGLIGDYGQRLVRAGQPVGRMWIEWILAAADFGDRDLALRAAGELRRLHQEGLFRDGLWFKHEIFIGEYDAAIRRAESAVMTPGRTHHFERIWFDLPLLLLRVGRVADARKWATKALGLVTINDNFYWVFGKLVACLALSGRLTDAAKLCGRCQRALHATADPLTHLHFHLNVVVLFDRLHDLGTETVMTRFGDDVPGRLPSGRYVVAAVRDWMRRNATEYTARFDARNGNDYFTRQLAERTAWQQFAQPAE